MVQKKNVLDSHPKYSMGVGESFSNGRSTRSVYSDSLVTARKELYKLCRSVKWHNSGSDPIGYVYEYGFVDPYKSGKKYWAIKKDIAYLTYDKKSDLLWWKPQGKERRLVKSDGTLGIAANAYYKNLNKLRGL